MKGYFNNEPNLKNVMEYMEIEKRYKLIYFDHFSSESPNAPIAVVILYGTFYHENHHYYFLRDCEKLESAIYEKEEDGKVHFEIETSLIERFCLFKIFSS